MMILRCSTCENLVIDFSADENKVETCVYGPNGVKVGIAENPVPSDEIIIYVLACEDEGGKRVHYKKGMPTILKSRQDWVREQEVKKVSAA